MDGVNTYNCQCPPEWTGSARSEGGTGWAGGTGPAWGDVGHSVGRAVLLHITSGQCQLCTAALSPARSVLH